MKQILLPTDFSDNAWNAIFTVLKLYADLECQFILLHAYEPKTLNKVGRKGQQRLGAIYESLSAYSNQELGKVLKYLEKNHINSKHRFEILSKPGALKEAIRETLLEKDIDLITMGTQGASGAKQVFIGSNTARVLQHIDSCPILVVPSEHDFKNLSVLAFPTDFSKKFSKRQFKPLTELTSIWKPEVQIVHVALEFALNDRQKANQKLLRKRFEFLDLTFRNLDFEAGVAQTLEAFISNFKVDLMALIRYRHTFWEKLIAEPVVKKMTFHTKVPLLVLPDEI